MRDIHFTVRTADWPEDAEALRRVRQQVFVVEQKVPSELEWDGEDEGSHHLLAMDANAEPIGTARLLPTGQVGRMAVLKDWRGRGVGSAMLNQLLDIRSETSPLFLNAQVHAVSFYKRLGFHPVGEVFDEAGIDHVRMEFCRE